MNIIYDTLFQEIRFDIENQILINIWKENAERMEDEDYKTEMLVLLQYTIEMESRYSISDLRKLNYTVNIELQEWTGNEVFPKLLQSNLLKAGFVVSPEFYTQLSVEQTMEENTVDTFQSRYFDDFDNAVQWILK